jgi:hypothetical protein
VLWKDINLLYRKKIELLPKSIQLMNHRILEDIAAKYATDKDKSTTHYDEYGEFAKISHQDQQLVLEGLII